MQPDNFIHPNDPIKPHDGFVETNAFFNRIRLLPTPETIDDLMIVVMKQLTRLLHPLFPGRCGSHAESVTLKIGYGLCEWVYHV